MPDQTRPMSMPVILMTDFGHADPYVGQVKGGLLRRHPGAVLIDLHHDLPPFAIASGAWLLERCRPHMPAPAVWLCVVDPGVGGARRGLAVQCQGSTFVGPDNGLLTPVFADGDWQAVALADPPPGASPTFHGRDLFAPAAGRLLQGAPLASLGTPVSDPVRLSDPGWRRTADGWRARVMLTDRYGNLITALPGTAVRGQRLTGRLNGLPCGGLVETFSSVQPGEAALVIGGFGTVEVVVNQGSAAARFVAAPGMELVVTLDGGGVAHAWTTRCPASPV